MGCGGSAERPEEETDKETETISVVPSAYGYLRSEGQTGDFGVESYSSKSSDHDYLFKILLIGSSGVGKSALLMRFASDIFHTSFASTIGVDFKIRTVDVAGKTIKMQIWDTAGQERFKTVTKAYFRGCHGILLVYDITKMESLEALQDWLDQVENHAPANCLKLMVGNKCDLDEEREVSHDDALEFAKERGLCLFETSAKEATKVNEAFLKLAEDILERIKQMSKKD
mmetsp:Transcript_9973/g.28038  ORF Transcript_9973/g.28038 Transcript_9973/m.28038 type:complete len:228 (-) Transcript_9973:88-771(-)|eukprot:CAMPEP_0119122456 /NCGR_PEP_ID=MMETSP1310-20130426/2710_1 /TAXON_ID=464262 /ORGANISM="Genus nov. species nov., Strain RCC2339" /LENGTH=227 /DNA_ID=CAMNT_0007112113 /DNA_START=77 /DNA_END=760 /DNA_ORIENTATION=+